MERLTKRTANGKVAYALLQAGECVDPIDLLRVWGDRLAAYEDIGLEPEEIDSVFIHSVIEENKRFAKLAKAEKDGRLVVLPCKVGDFVWVTDDCVRDWSATLLPYKCWVFGIEITEKENRLLVECCKTGRIFPFDFDQTGKTVFLTREDAEAALKRREEG